MIWFKAVLCLHVAFGIVALAAFWVTAALRKGTRQHRRIGSTYLIAMIGVMVTAIPLAASAFAAGHTVTGVFLAYLVVITATPVWKAWQAIRDRRSIETYISGLHRPIGWANVLCAAAVLAVGIVNTAPLLDGLSIVGLFIGIRMLRVAATPPTNRDWWLKQHYTNIVGSGIAMHIAFLNVGVAQLFPRALTGFATYLAWFGPVVIAILAVRWLNRKYARGHGEELLRQ